MTDEQWQKIEAWVMRELGKVASVEIGVEEFATLFSLDRPFFPELRQRALTAGLPWTAEGHWRDLAGDPTGPLTFARR